VANTVVEIHAVAAFSIQHFYDIRFANIVIGQNALFP